MLPHQQLVTLLEIQQLVMKSLGRRTLIPVSYTHLCIKDMAGVLTPQTGFELVSKMKDAIDLPLEVHTHATSGISEMTYLKVAEAGADIIDTATVSYTHLDVYKRQEPTIVNFRSNEDGK